ncbi:MAG: ATP-binding protein [Roseovarius sp.]|nr:ATP-binding protein [Roseovarius sp.]
MSREVENVNAISSTDVLESERNLVSILKRLRDEVYIFNAETLRFSYLNDAALKSVGWSIDKISEKSMSDLTRGFDEEKFRVIAQPLLMNEAVQVNRTFVFNGRPYDADLQLIRNEDVADQFVCVMRDASARLESERIKSEFVSTVSHELRSPMTSIKGAMGLVLSGAAGKVTDKTRDLLEIAHRNADRLILIINDILDLEKLDANAMVFDNQIEDMSEMLREAVEAIGPFSNRFDVNVITQGLDAPVMAYFDHNRMMQVMTNLLSNAVKVSPTGGKVVVELCPTETGLRVEVSDQGKGIPEEKQSAIFERFSQLASESAPRMRGTGLGLSIVKTIVEKQGGTVGFTSKEFEGSTFFFHLPTTAVKDGEMNSVARG